MTKSEGEMIIVNFDDVFEEVPIIVKRLDEACNEPYMCKFNNDYFDDYEMCVIRIKKNDYAFSFYLGSDGNRAWGNCHSLHDESPFKGIKMFKSIKHVFKRNYENENEIIQVEYTYCRVGKVFRVKKESKIKFHDEGEFQFMVKQFDIQLKNCHNVLLFVKPTIKIDKLMLKNMRV